MRIRHSHPRELTASALGEGCFWSFPERGAFLFAGSTAGVGGGGPCQCSPPGQVQPRTEQLHSQGWPLAGEGRLQDTEPGLLLLWGSRLSGGRTLSSQSPQSSSYSAWRIYSLFPQCFVELWTRCQGTGCGLLLNLTCVT